MKRSILFRSAILFLGLAMLTFNASCDQNTGPIEEDPKPKDEALERQCEHMNANIASFKAVVAVLENEDYVTNVESLKEDSSAVGYTISFNESSPVVIYDDVTPVIAIKKDGDIYYWTLNGELILDDKGSRLPLEQDTVIPQLKVEDNKLAVSYNDGKDWTVITSDDNNATIQITQDENNVHIAFYNEILILSKKPKDIPVTTHFTINIKDVTSTTVKFDVQAEDDNMRYLLMSIDKEYADNFEDDEALYQDDISYFSQYVGYGFETLEEVIEAFTTTGDYFDLEQGDLEPGTEYMIYVYGLELDGTRTTEIYREYFTTKDIEKTDMTFDIDAVVDGASIDVTITPSDVNTYYYFDCISRESLILDFEGDINNAAKYYIDYNIQLGSYYYGMTAEEVVIEIGSLGTDQYLFECDPNTEYIIFAVALSTDGIIISDVATEECTTGDVALSDNQITLNVDDKTNTTITVSTTTTNNDPYFLGIEPAIYYEGMTDDEIIEAVISYYGDYISYATEQGDVEALELIDLEPGTEYLLMAFGIQGGNATTSLVKQYVSTEDGTDPSLCTFEITIDGITSTSVEATVTPSVYDVRYYWNVIEAGFSDQEIMDAIKTDIDRFIEGGDVSSAFEYWQMVTYTGIDSWTYDYLTPGTDYEIFAVAIDMSTCDAAAAFTRQPFTTPAADAAQMARQSAESTLRHREESEKGSGNICHRAILKEATNNPVPMRIVEKQDKANNIAPANITTVRHSALIRK